MNNLVKSAELVSMIPSIERKSNDEENRKISEKKVPMMVR